MPKQSMPLFFIVHLQRLDCSVASLLPERQKAPLRQKLHPPSQSERAACAFHCPSPAAKTVGHFTPSLEAKGASSSGVPMPSCSERAACAFHCLAPPPSPSCLRTFRTRRQKASSVRKNLSQQG